MDNMKQDCTDLAPLLEKFLDGDLDSNSAIPIVDHLALCSACRQEVDQERMLQEALSTLPPEVCPEPIVGQIARATYLAEPTQPAGAFGRSWLPRWGRPRLVGFSAAVLAAMLLFLFLPRDRLPEPNDSQFSPTEVTAAREQAKLSLMLTAQLIQKSEIVAMRDVLGEQLPQAIRKSLWNAFDRSKGGQG